MSIFEPDSMVRVTEGPLRLRSKPSTSDDSDKYVPLLETGQLLFVIAGPERGADYDWYLVDPISGPQAPLGWVAAADHDGTPWLRAATVSCPPDPSLSDLSEMAGSQRVHCYGSQAFTFTDTIHAGPLCGDPTFLGSPALMASCLGVFLWGEPDFGVLLAIPPELAAPVGPDEIDETIEATVEAHMDHPAARTCEGEYYEPRELDPVGFVLGCRAMFVATSFERLSP